MRFTSWNVRALHDDLPPFFFRSPHLSCAVAPLPDAGLRRVCAVILCSTWQLNITASSSYIKKKMKEVDFNGDGVLQFKEFVFLMRFPGERPEVLRTCVTYLPRTCCTAALDCVEILFALFFCAELGGVVDACATTRRGRREALLTVLAASGCVRVAVCCVVLFGEEREYPSDVQRCADSSGCRFPQLFCPKECYLAN